MSNHYIKSLLEAAKAVCEDAHPHYGLNGQLDGQVLVSLGLVSTLFKVVKLMLLTKEEALLEHGEMLQKDLQGKLAWETLGEGYFTTLSKKIAEHFEYDGEEVPADDLKARQHDPALLAYIEKLEAEIARLKRSQVILVSQRMEVETKRDELAEAFLEHRKATGHILQGVKKALGLEYWPQRDIDFCDLPGTLVAEALAAQARTHAEEIRRLRYAVLGPNAEGSQRDGGWTVDPGWLLGVKEEIPDEDVPLDLEEIESIVLVLRKWAAAPAQPEPEDLTPLEKAEDEIRAWTSAFGLDPSDWCGDARSALTAFRVWVEHDKCDPDAWGDVDPDSIVGIVARAMGTLSQPQLGGEA